jgi:hypothetical protein
MTLDFNPQPFVQPPRNGTSPIASASRMLRHGRPNELARLMEAFLAASSRPSAPVAQPT